MHVYHNNMLKLSDLSLITRVISCLALDKYCKEEFIVKVNIGLSQECLGLRVKALLGDLEESAKSAHCFELFIYLGNIM